MTVHSLIREDDQISVIWRKLPRNKYSGVAHAWIHLPSEGNLMGELTIYYGAKTGYAYRVDIHDVTDLANPEPPCVCSEYRDGFASRHLAEAFCLAAVFAWWAEQQGKKA